MALSRTDFGPYTSVDGTGTGSYTTPSLTPGAGELLVIFVHAQEQSGATDPSGTLTLSASNSITLTPIDNIGAVPGWSGGIQAWYGTHTSGSLTFTADCGTRDINNYSIRVFSYSGAHASPIGAKAKSTTWTTPGGAASMTLSGSPASSSEVLAAAFVEYNAGSNDISAGSDFTEIAENERADYWGAEYQARTSSTSTTVSWTDLQSAGGSLSGVYSLFAVEIKAAASGGSTTTKTMTDTLTLTDAALDPTYRVRQMSEAVAVTDGAVFWRRLVRVMDEGVTAVDSIVKTLVTAGGTVYTKVMSETLSIVDGFVDWLRRVRGPIDTVTLSDGDTYRTAIITASETLDITDDFVSWRRLKRVMGENLDIIDGFSKTIAGAGIVYAKVMSDAITLIDDAGRRWSLRASRLTDTVGLSDQVLDYLRLVRTLGDDIEFSDGTVKIRRTIRSMDESLEISDSKISTLYLDSPSSVSFKFGASGPPFRFGGM